jgi:polar amino acid transport system substrate-binding protein
MIHAMLRHAFCGLTLSLLALGQASAQAKPDTLVVGAYPTNPPFELKNAQGVFEGFEVDIVTEIAKRLNLKVEISDLGFQALFAATASGRIDVAISTITITAERLKSQTFSQPYFDSEMGLATRKDSAVKTLADVKGKTLGGLSGSTGEKWLKENQAKYGIAALKGYNTQQDLLLDLAAKRVDAIVSDVPGMLFAFQKMTDLAVKERIRTGEQYGLMIKKDHPWAGRIDGAITAMKKDGTMRAIYKKWFGVDAPADSSTVKEAPMPKA